VNKKRLRKLNRKLIRKPKKTPFIKAVLEGLRDLEKGKVFSVAETKAKFGIK